MLPFTVDKMLMSMRDNMEHIKSNVIKYKFDFSNDFVKELKLQGSIEYADTVFDYIYNLFFFKKAFGPVAHKKYVEELKDQDFRHPPRTCAYISNKYASILIIYKKYFMDYYGFTNDDPQNWARKIAANRSTIIEKVLNYYE